MNSGVHDLPPRLPADRNPFRTERLDALAFRPHHPDLTADAVVERFRAAGWHGAVVGPHGSGKSTLLKRLVAEAATGHRVVELFVNRQTPRAQRRAELARVIDAIDASGAQTPAAVVACDGWCHLPPWERRRLLRAARRARAGVLGLAHLCGWGLPVVYRTRASQALFASLVHELEPRAEPAAAHAAWSVARGNVRDALFELYDRRAGR